MIISTIRMKIPHEKRNDALKILRSITEQCRDNPECTHCHIYGDLQDNDFLILEQIWKNEENLNLHIRSDEYLNLLLVVEMALKKPDIRFHTISNSTGIETIEKARNHAK